MRRRALLAAVAGLLATMPECARSMTADGSVITNYACVTGYWGIAGPAYASRYTMSFSMTAPAIVSNPVVLAYKTIAPAQSVAAGGTLTFTTWVVNMSLQCTSFNLVIREGLADNVGYVSPSVSTWAGGGGAWTVGYSTDGAAWVTGQPPNGADASIAPYVLRWVVDRLGPNRSAFVSFKAVVL